MRSRTFFGVALAFAALPLSFDAQADPTDADRALATQLFREGRVSLEKKDYDEACPKLAESERLDPGGGTLLNLALCHRAQGKLATAWAELNQALGWARRDDRPDRVDLANQQLEELEPLLARLVVEVPNESDVPRLVITRDGTTLGRPAWGSLVPIDPGDHVIEASATGRAHWRQTIHVDEGPARPVVKIPPLELEPVFAPPPQPMPLSPVVIVTKSAPAPLRRPTPFDVRKATRASSYVAFGVGGASTLIAAVTGGLAINKRRESNAECRSICTPRAYTLNDQAKPLADASTATIVLAAASVTAGVVLFAVSFRGKSPGSSAALRATLSGQSLTITGGF